MLMHSTEAKEVELRRRITHTKGSLGSTNISTFAVDRRCVLEDINFRADPPFQILLK